MKLFQAPDGVVDMRDLLAWSAAPFAPAPPPAPAARSLPPDHPGPFHASWDLGGGRGEAAFWAEARRREAASGVYLADLLAGRPPGGPHADRAGVPASVSPLRFLLENVLRGDGTLVRVRAGAIGPAGSVRLASAQARRFAPPHRFLIVQVEAPEAADPFDPDAAGHGPQPAPLAAVARAADPGPAPPALSPSRCRALPGRTA